MNYKQKYLKALNLADGEFCPCARCGKSATSVHHRTHKSQGGTDDIQNLEGLCHNCHHNEHFK